MHIAIDGIECYAYTGGRPLDGGKPTVVFVHGAANDHSVWTLQARYFAHHGCNVLAVDLPAHGRSGGAPLASVEAIADWVPQVLDATGVARAALVVPMLVSDELLAAAHADDHVAFELINGWSFSAGRQLGGNAVPGMWMIGNSLRLMERTRKGVLYADLLACQSYANGLAAASAVRCPTLAIMGARDVMTPVNGAQALLAALADRRSVILADTGHAMMAEQPDAVLDALRTFL